MINYYFNILLLWIGIAAFTGNLLKVYDNSCITEIVEESGEADDDTKAEEDTQEEKVKESEQYLSSGYFVVATTYILAHKSLITLHQFSTIQGYSSPIIKPPLV